MKFRILGSLLIIGVVFLAYWFFKPKPTQFEPVVAEPVQKGQL